MYKENISNFALWFDELGYDSVGFGIFHMSKEISSLNTARSFFFAIFVSHYDPFL